MSVVYDAMETHKQPQKFYKKILADAQHSLFTEVCIKNAQYCDKTLEYTLLYWLRKKPNLKIVLESPYNCLFRFLEGRVVYVKRESERASLVDRSELIVAIREKNKEAIRAWVLAAFAKGVDPRDWADPEWKSLQFWKHTVWYGNVHEQMKQAISFYVDLLIVSGLIDDLSEPQ